MRTAQENPAQLLSSPSAPPADISRINRFNRACVIFLAVWLLVIAPLILTLSPKPLDFPQFYMGGLMARLGLWQDLYPIPHPLSLYNPGGRDDSDMRPRYAELATKHGVDDTYRFIQSPVNAVLLMPLAFLSFRQAHALWLIGMCFCGWLITLQTGRAWTLIQGRPTRAAGMLAVLVGFSPGMYRAIQVGNVSPLVGAAVGAAVLGMMDDRRGHEVREGLYLLLGAIGKYATFCLVPLALLLRRWRSVVWFALGGLALLLLALLVAGRAPFVEFTGKIAPTLDRSHPVPANHAVEGVLMRMLHVPILSPGWHRGVHMVSLGCVALILVLLVRRRLAADLHKPAMVLAAGLALQAWMLIFAPISWPHYTAFLYPFWGYLAWEALQGWWLCTIVIVALACHWIPRVAVNALHLPEPLSSYLMLGTILMLLLSVHRLWKGLPQTAGRAVG